MAKTRLAPSPHRKKAVLRSPNSLTLADVTIRWKTGDQVHEMPGALVAQLIRAERVRYPFTPAGEPVDKAFPVGAMLRGLGAMLFPDAGEPQETIEQDKRFLISEILWNAAATIDAESGCERVTGQDFSIIIGARGRRAS